MQMSEMLEENWNGTDCEGFKVFGVEMPEKRAKI